MFLWGVYLVVANRCSPVCVHFLKKNVFFCTDDLFLRFEYVKTIHSYKFLNVKTLRDKNVLTLKHQVKSNRKRTHECGYRLTP